ncbi:DUF2812 domain-containing protein [Gracilibacillus oryzae]|uniref:DUF2812 domain-containing protein n=1 Tax=Gracilibacillus oryzae TaxID=1672701 RepID=A0A7C8KPR5_9BACI|nr:DUF2812 domain-containing protein [Gracilibacillus oryzae]KAB8125972.1 DUF2812 domain-containing protein [Gracilibacillus oryzae]
MKRKKVKWFWSYKVNQTEKWLADLAAEGWHLIHVNHWTRIFTFEQGEKRRRNYRIQFSPNQSSIPETLQNEGWNIVFSAGNWLFLENDESTITLYPSRDSILKRNRRHAYISSALAIFQLATHLPIILISMILLWNEGDFSFNEPGSLVLMLLIGQGAALAILATYIFKSYRKFEMKEMGATIEAPTTGKKIRKFKPGWMYQPDKTNKWLEQLAREGYELVHVRASLFTFRKTDPGHIKYECTFEYKVQPQYFSIHQEVGWKLKFSSSSTILNYSIWAMSYSNEEDVPQFSYDKKEQKQAIKRAFNMNLAMSIYIIVISAVALYVNTIEMETGFVSWSFAGVIRPLLLVALIFWLYKFVQILVNYRRSVKAYQ